MNNGTNNGALNGAPHRAQSGTIFLVGAGPGDPDLLTVRAARLIGQADVLVHDGLVSDEILALAHPDARLISVAKQRARHTLPQGRHQSAFGA